MHQFNDSRTNVANFIAFVYNLIEKSLGKLNSLLVVGEATCGKTLIFSRKCKSNYIYSMLKLLHIYLFFLALCDLLITVGTLPSLHTNDRFAFHGCIDKKIIFADELHFDVTHIESLKLLLGGMNMAVRHNMS